MRVDKIKWMRSTLGEICSFKRGLTYPKTEESQEKTNNIVLRSNNINLDTYSLDFNELKYLNKSYAIPHDKTLRANSIFICMSNGSSKHIGKVAFIDKDYDYAFGGFMGLIVPTLIDAKFLYYKLRSESFKECITKISNGINITNLKFSSISPIHISFPQKVEEQHSIAQELDAIQAMIDGYRQQIADLDTLSQSIFYDMFGDPVINPIGWNYKKLGTLGEISSGGTPSRSNLLYYKGDIDWYSAGELNTLYLNGSKEKITQEAIDETSAKLFHPNSLFVGLYDTAAFKLGITSKAASANQACANILPEEANVVWLYYCLQGMRDYAWTFRKGVRQKNLTVGFLKSFTVPFPPLSLQHQFSTRIEKIEQQKAAYKQQLQDAETLMSERMQYYFS